MVVGDVAIGGLTKAMEGLSSQIRQAMDFADKAQRASLALGQTYEQTSTSLGGTMQGLRGDINQRFGAAIAGLEAGLQGNTAGVAKLINQQQLTGTAFGKTATAFAGLESSLQLSRDQTNMLSDSLIQTGDEYQISTDKLVGAIDALKATFPAQALAGMGDKVMGAVVGLQGELGPQLAGSLQKVMNMVMDTSMEGYQRLTMLGIGDVRERLSAAKDSAEAQRILKDAFVTASNSFKSVAGDASKGFFQIGVASQIFGSQAIELTTVADNLGKRIRKEGDQAADFGKTLANLKAEILVPFQEAFAIAYPFILEAMDVFSAIMNTVGQRFKAFAESLGGKDGASETMKTFKLAVIDFAIAGLGNLEGAFEFTKKIITEAVPSAFGTLSQAINNLTIPGGPIDHLKLVFATIAEAGARTAQAMGSDTAGDIADAAYMLKRDMEYRIQQMDAASRGYGMGDVASQAFFFKMMDRGLKGEELFDAMQKFKEDPEQFTFIGKMKDMAELSFGENAKRSPMYQQLKDIRDNIENDKPLREATDKNIEDINRKTPEIATTSEFLDETANMLGRSIERILGVSPDTTAEEMLEELRVANEQRAAAAMRPEGGGPINTGD